MSLLKGGDEASPHDSRSVQNSGGRLCEREVWVERASGCFVSDARLACQAVPAFWHFSAFKGPSSSQWLRRSSPIRILKHTYFLLTCGRIGAVGLGCGKFFFFLFPFPFPS